MRLIYNGDDVYDENHEIQSIKNTIGTGTLDTDEKTIIPAINELKSNLTVNVTTSNNITYTKMGNMRRIDCRWETYGNMKSFYAGLPSADRTTNFYVGTFIIALNTFNYQRMAYVGTETTGTALVGQLCTNYNNGTGSPASIPDEQILMGSLEWYVS